MQHEDVPAGDTTVTLTFPITLDLQNGTELQSTDVDSCWFAVRENATGDGSNGYSWSYIHTSRASGPVSDANSLLGRWRRNWLFSRRQGCKCKKSTLAHI